MWLKISLCLKDRQAAESNLRKPFFLLFSVLDLNHESLTAIFCLTLLVIIFFQPFNENDDGQTLEAASSLL